MTQIEWDQPGEKRFETGISRGVLYPPDGPGVPWNGLTAVDESSDRDTKAFYMEGVKYLERQIPGEFSATLKAFTYPDELESLIGIEEFAPGVDIHDQSPSTFGLSYRTSKGNDMEGADASYRIHVIYNVFAAPDATTFATQGEDITPTDFSWDLTATPEIIEGFRPTAHISFDSSEIYAPALADMENVLYGTEVTSATLPDLETLLTLFSAEGTISIVDNGDGTWTAVVPDEVVTMLDSETFQISHVSPHYLSADMYEISTSNLTKEA